MAIFGPGFLWILFNVSTVAVDLPPCAGEKNKPVGCGRGARFDGCFFEVGWPGQGCRFRSQRFSAEHRVSSRAAASQDQHNLVQFGRPEFG